MWRRVDFVCLLLHSLSIAFLWREVSAQSGADGPCNTCPVECVGRRCERQWWTTMWGFIVTLVALTMDCWGHTKSYHISMSFRVVVTLSLGVLNPLYMVWHMLLGGVLGISMLSRLRDVPGDDVIAPLYPWTKSHIKIVAGTDIIVNLSQDAYNEVSNFNTFEGKSLRSKKDYSEALVIGGKVQDSLQYDLGLSELGKLALLRSKVLPPYDQLKILRGSSSLGMAVAAIQAVGYIYGIIVRCAQGLRVSPVEVIACLLNIVVLMKVVLHNLMSLAHRPLLLYLPPGDENKFIEECKIVNFQELKGPKVYIYLVFILAVSLSAVMGYFIFIFIKYLNIVCVVPIIMFEVALFLGGLAGIFILYMSTFFNFLRFLMFVIVLLNVVGYIWAVVVTIKYWKGEKFDVHSSNYFSQILPYVG